MAASSAGPGAPDRRPLLDPGRWPQLRSTAVVFRLPLTIAFRGITAREGILLRGSAGWAEFAPFWDYSLAQCVPWLRASIASAERLWPAARREAVAVNAIVPAVDPERAQQLVARAGANTVKVKVAQAGQGLAEDLARLSAVREALGSAGRIRCDANAAWTVDQAAEVLPQLDSAAGGLEYAEQPVRTVDELVELRRRIRVPIAADESIRLAGDPLAVARRGAADVAILKVAPLGGVDAVLELAAAFAEFGMPCVVSSALDSSVGLAAGVAAAAALPVPPLACGLGTGSLLADDVTADRLVVTAGQLATRPHAPEPDRLDAVRADRATSERWLDRLDGVAAQAGLLSAAKPKPSADHAAEPAVDQSAR